MNALHRPHLNDSLPSAGRRFGRTASASRPRGLFAGRLRHVLSPSSTSSKSRPSSYRMRGKGISSRQHETTTVDLKRAAALDRHKDHSSLLPSVPNRERITTIPQPTWPVRRARQRRASATPARRERQNDLTPRRGGKTGLRRRKETTPQTRERSILRESYPEPITRADGDRNGSGSETQPEPNRPAPRRGQE
jgi:hypothetical protein